MLNARRDRDTTLSVTFQIIEHRIILEKTAEHSDFRRPVGLLNRKRINVALRYSDPVHNYPSRTLNQRIPASSRDT